MHPNLDRAINEIDAAVFNGDVFENPDERKTMLEYLERWCKRLAHPYHGTKAPQFDEEWAKYVVRGYNYGQDALENVKFGFAIAAEAYSRGYIEPEGDDDVEEGTEDKEEGGGQEDG